MSSFPVGKVPASFLEELWRRFGSKTDTLIQGPGVGRDVAVVDLGDEYLVAKTDPITFATDRIGWYAVHINANDVACSGAQPEWFLATLLLPESQASEDTVESIFEQLAEACESVGAALIGGHTEVTHSIDRPIVMGCLLGRVEKDRLITSTGVQPGDAILLTGGVPIEATAIIARELGDQLEDDFSPAFLERCRHYLFDPGLSVLAESRLAVQNAEIHAMHDPTEGGLITGLWELAQASQVDLHINQADIVVLPEGWQLCDHLGLDPLGAIASGALLLALPAAEVDSLLEVYKENGISCAQIGRAQPGTGQLLMKTATGSQAVQPPARDEIARLFETDGQRPGVK